MIILNVLKKIDKTLNSLKKNICEGCVIEKIPSIKNGGKCWSKNEIEKISIELNEIKDLPIEHDCINRVVSHRGAYQRNLSFVRDEWTEKYYPHLIKIRGWNINDNCLSCLFDCSKQDKDEINYIKEKYKHELLKIQCMKYKSSELNQ